MRGDLEVALLGQVFDEGLFDRRLRDFATRFLRNVDQTDGRFLAKERGRDVGNLNDLLRHLPAARQNERDARNRHDRAGGAVGELSLPHLIHEPFPGWFRKPQRCSPKRRVPDPC